MRARMAAKGLAAEAGPAAATERTPVGKLGYGPPRAKLLAGRTVAPPSGAERCGPPRARMLPGLSKLARADGCELGYMPLLPLDAAAIKEPLLLEWALLGWSPPAARLPGELGTVLLLSIGPPANGLTAGNAGRGPPADGLAAVAANLGPPENGLGEAVGRGPPENGLAAAPGRGPPANGLGCRTGPMPELAGCITLRMAAACGVQSLPGLVQTLAAMLLCVRADATVLPEGGALPVGGGPLLSSPPSLPPATTTVGSCSSFSCPSPKLGKLPSTLRRRRCTYSQAAAAAAATATAAPTAIPAIAPAARPLLPPVLLVLVLLVLPPVLPPPVLLLPVSSRYRAFVGLSPMDELSMFVFRTAVTWPGSCPVEHGSDCQQARC